MDGLPPLPPWMAAATAAADEAEARQMVIDEAAEADEREMQRHMAVHAEHVHEAATGYSIAEVRQWQEQRNAAADERGWDPSAPLGSPQHPEPLCDGETVVRRSALLAPLAREDPDSMSALLARNAALDAAWHSPPIVHQRQLALESEISRSGGSPPPRRAVSAQPPREIRRVIPLSVPGAPMIGDY